MMFSIVCPVCVEPTPEVPTGGFDVASGDVNTIFGGIFRPIFEFLGGKNKQRFYRNQIFEHLQIPKRRLKGIWDNNVNTTQ